MSDTPQREKLPRWSGKRLCAHRGASGIRPENTIPSFAKALELKAPEVEFDLWASADGVVFVHHDPEVTLPGNGGLALIAQTPWSVIRECDVGRAFGKEWAGTRVPRVEEVFELLAGKCVMNIHVKDPGPGGLVIERVRDLAATFHAEDSLYVTGRALVLNCARDKAPRLERCTLEGQENGAKQVAQAGLYDCRRIQLTAEVSTDADIIEAKKLGYVVNYFQCDNPAEGARLFRVGVDVLLTNHIERYADSPSVSAAPRGG